MFAGAVLYGAILINEFNEPYRVFVAHTLEKAGKSSDLRGLLASGRDAERVAFIIAIISVASGVGLARAIEEISKAIAVKREHAE